MLVLTIKRLACFLDLIVLEGAMQTAKGKSHPFSYPAIEPVNCDNDQPSKIGPWGQ